MQRHGQVLPPCRCIAGIASGEYICRGFLRDRMGRGGEVIDKIGRGAHLPRPKSFSCFRALLMKAREAPLKKRKRSETARPQFWFWIKIRVNPIYLVIFLWLPPLLTYLPGHKKHLKDKVRRSKSFLFSCRVKCQECMGTT